MNHRPERVASLIREELSAIILKNLEFPTGCLATITEVKVDKKLEHAIVGFSVIPSSKCADVLRVLKKSAGDLQYLLLKRINIKPMPRISFEIDHGIEKAAKIEKLLLDDKIEE